MKKIFTLFLLLTIFSSFGQTISTREGNEKFSTGNQNAVITTVFENNIDNVIEEWKKTLRDFKHEKVKDKDNEVFGDNILIKDWGNNTVDFYAKFEEDKKIKTIKLMLAVDLGGAYLSSVTDKDKFKYIEKMAKEFAIKMTKQPVENLIKEATKLQEKAEDKQKDLVKDKKNLQEDIEGYKKKINKTEKDIVDKKSDIEKKKSEVSVQKKVVDASSDAVSEQAKSSKKILEKLKDQLKDLEKDEKDLKNDIEDQKEKIKKAEKNIKENEDNQVKKKKEIEDQIKIIDGLKRKLEGVN